MTGGGSAGAAAAAREPLVLPGQREVAGARVIEMPGLAWRALAVGHPVRGVGGRPAPGAPERVPEFPEQPGPPAGREYASRRGYASRREAEGCGEYLEGSARWQHEEWAGREASAEEAGLFVPPRPARRGGQRSASGSGGRLSGHAGPRPRPRPRAGTGTGRRPQPPLRLTRRGRIVLGLLASMVLGVVFSAVLVTSSQAFTGTPVAYETHRVLPGETLWEIARGIDPDADTREIVGQLMALNGLPTAALLPGQRLRLP
ncbi:LysM peptidoglycan-binding domain-containing protein [Parafrankia elaeagni]|uniref:LysM peptidoglycan-binding domain-containing protein n=1 Tax=Parafrankia elaeagni TaxID=222534 RepID=UPI000379E028|nr:LysM peptidoglycan-binding domain-containing protein [Parafrankia elaeagni]